MAKPGPAKGSGGRPRGTGSQRGDGYSLTTVGPPSKGTRQYVHRVVASGGKPGGGKLAPVSSKAATKGIVDHRNRNKQDSRPANLHKVTKGQNNSNR